MEDGEFEVRGSDHAAADLLRADRAVGNLIAPHRAYRKLAAGDRSFEDLGGANRSRGEVGRLDCVAGNVVGADLARRISGAAAEGEKESEGGDDVRVGKAWSVPQASPGHFD